MHAHTLVFIYLTLYMCRQSNNACQLQRQRGMTAAFAVAIDLTTARASSIVTPFQLLLLVLIGLVRLEEERPSQLKSLRIQHLDITMHMIRVTHIQSAHTQHAGYRAI